MAGVSRQRSQQEWCVPCRAIRRKAARVCLPGSSSPLHPACWTKHSMCLRFRSYSVHSAASWDMVQHGYGPGGCCLMLGPPWGKLPKADQVSWVADARSI